MAENLINISDINEYVSLSENYDATKLNNFIKVVQDMKIKKLLGNDLYDDYFDNPEDYTTLLPYMKKTLIFWTMDMYYREGDMFNTPTGTLFKQSDYAERPQDYQLKILIESNCEKAKFYEAELYDFLVLQDYPLWVNPEKRNQPCGRISIRSVDGLNSLSTNNTTC